MNTKKFTTIIIVLTIVILGAFAVYYTISKKQGTSLFIKKTTSVMPTKTELLSRLTAPLNRQSSSTNIKDIKADLNATNLASIDEGINK